MHLDDTIAAVATPPGEGGIAIVRISGPDALEIADRIFQCHPPGPSERAGATFVHGRVRHDDELIDDALLLIMRAPNSYTREDVVEIQGHGGSVCVRRILHAALQAGARLAEPGEFTRRAFLNGRIDLVQAEAVLDLIRAKSERAATAALDQLEGSLSVQFNALYDQALSVAADLEATLDFPEDELPAPVMEQIRAAVRDQEGRMRDLLATWGEGHLLRDGASVVISGQPNVGKSTLLNALLGTDRAIVSHAPGTTRDSIEEGFVLDGIPLRLIDTAGLRQTDNDIEREGIKRARSHIERADLHLYVLDASQPLAEADRIHVDTLIASKSIVVLNKVDLGEGVTVESLQPLTCVRTSLTDRRGLDDLRAAMAAKLEADLDLSAPPHAVISERHRQLLQQAHEALIEASRLVSTQSEDDIPLASSQLRTCLEHLGTVTGRTYENELLDSIFSRFCIGK